jgi:hypothetical protein
VSERFVLAPKPRAKRDRKAIAPHAITLTDAKTASVRDPGAPPQDDTLKSGYTKS